MQWTNPWKAQTTTILSIWEKQLEWEVEFMGSQKVNLQAQVVSLKNSTQPCRNELAPILHNLFQKIELPPKSRYKARIIFYPNQTKMVEKKDYRPIFVINIGTYIPNKTLTSRTQYIQIIITMTKLGLFQ